MNIISDLKAPSNFNLDYFESIESDRRTHMSQDRRVITTPRRHHLPKKIKIESH